MATGLNHTSDITSFRDRADWWQNQWKPSENITLPGEAGIFTGFPAPCNSDGSWNYTSYKPVTCDNCGWSGDIYEATVWETAFSAAPHDMARLIDLMGGDDDFIKRLDTFVPGLGQGTGNANNDAGTAVFNLGNEPSFMTPWLYHHVPGKQWKTVNQTRAIIDQFYSDERNGYPGNTDSGALPSWLVWNLIGLYPVVAQPIYLIGAPRFSGLRVKLFAGTGREAVLEIKAEGMANDKFYPQSVMLNGQRLDRSWISHDELSKGGTLSSEMGSEPGDWVSGERPPSLSPWMN